MLCSRPISARVSGLRAFTLLTACLMALARLTSGTVSACSGERVDMAAIKG